MILSNYARSSLSVDDADPGKTRIAASIQLSLVARRSSRLVLVSAGAIPRAIVSFRAYMRSGEITGNAAQARSDEGEAPVNPSEGATRARSPPRAANGFSTLRPRSAREKGHH
jgi:hypothetical protein